MERQPRLKFSLRHLLLGVAMVALLLEAAHLGRRSFDFSRKAAVCEQRERLARSAIAAALLSLRRHGRQPNEGPIDEVSLPRMRAREAYYGALGRKYRRAAARPWETVPPDAPPPLPPGRAGWVRQPAGFVIGR